MKQIAFVGSKALGARVLDEIYRLAPEHLACAITIDDSSDVRCALGTFQAFAERTGVPLRVLTKSSELRKAIVAFQPDLCIVVGWYWILKPELLGMVPGGWLGIHASLLPKNRGGAPLVWAILNGQSETGLSLFYFDQGMDTGDIVAQKKFPIEYTDTIADVLAKTEQMSIEVIQENLPALVAGSAPRHVQDHSQATFVALRSPEDGKIRWDQNAQALYNFIRAQTHPYPGAFCLTDAGDTVRIWKASVFPYPYYGQPGQVALVEADGVIVTCGSGTALCVHTVQVNDGDESSPVGVLKFGQRLQ